MQLNIAIAQLRPKKGDYAANIARLGEVFAQLAALESQPDILVLAETALTGYFLEGGVRDTARTAGQVFADLQAAYLAARGSDAPPLDVVAGFYERYRDRYYNSAIYTTLGVGGWGLGVGAELPTPNPQPPPFGMCIGKSSSRPMVSSTRAASSRPGIISRRSTRAVVASPS